MKALINNALLFCVSMLFCEQALTQSNNPKGVYRCSYDSNGLNQLEFEILPTHFYPWGVCVHHHNYLNRQERYWARVATRIWNEKYEDYILRQWGTLDVVNIPTGKLFVPSCDRSKYNIIYISKADLDYKGAAADYASYDYWWDFATFYAEIRMNENIRWTREWFINVMIHELGHALGLPHAINTNYSLLMIPAGFGCIGYKTENICKFKDYDFEVFLEPYDPPSVAENKRAQARAEAERRYKEAEKEFYSEWACFGGRGGFGRGTVGCIRY